MDEGMSGFCLKGGAKCGRWNPTTEQVKVLTDLFRSGLRTPSTDQIQKISSHLSFYGKIESKNVFYWFQNHKARERQKRRRISIPHHDTNHFLIPPSKCKLNYMYIYYIYMRSYIVYYMFITYVSYSDRFFVPYIRCNCFINISFFVFQIMGGMRSDCMRGRWGWRRRG